MEGISNTTLGGKVDTFIGLRAFDRWVSRIAGDGRGIFRQFDV